MKARKLIADSVYDPAKLKAVGQAFDDAWEQVAPQVSKRPAAIEAARMKLAEIVLSLTKNGISDPDKLRDEAIRLMLSGPTKLK